MSVWKKDEKKIETEKNLTKRKADLKNDLVWITYLVWDQYQKRGLETYGICITSKKHMIMY